MGEKRKTNISTEEDFPVPQFNRIDAAFGAPADSYLTREALGDEFYGLNGPLARTASMLFFKGGKLEDHGLRFKPGINQEQAYLALRAWLCSFAPKHEIKIGTVAFALSKWCEPMAAADVS